VSLWASTPRTFAWIRLAASISGEAVWPRATIYINRSDIASSPRKVFTMISFNLDGDAQKVQRSKFNSSILQFDTHGMRRCVPDNPDFVHCGFVPGGRPEGTMLYESIHHWGRS
jgi:hypothetical protein